jgi:hypothetical protein
MIVLGAITIVGLLVALLLAGLVYLVAAWIGAPQPVAAILAVLVFLLVLFNGIELGDAEASVTAARYWGLST